jgi:hypothetical protein
MALVGCPFCQELFPEGETPDCPVCGMSLKPAEKLPPSYEARVALAAELAQVAPEDRTLPLWYYRRSRGALVLLSIAGLVAFFMPWVLLHKPDEIVYSGYLLARARGSWFFGGAVGWFVMVPLVISRRTIYKMRGVRIITATFASLSLLEALMLLSHPPRGNHYYPIDFDWGPGLYATAVIGFLGVIFAARFGGRIDDIDTRDLPEPAPELSPDQSVDRTLH